jgi:hypothetical protein
MKIVLLKIFNNHHRVGFIWFFVLVAMLLFGGRLWKAWQWNWFGLQLMKGEEASIPAAFPDCFHVWLVGRAAGMRGNLPT